MLINCFMFYFRLFGYSNGEKGIIWSNPHPSSTLFCRPIRFSYKKETDVLKEEEQFLRNSIEKLFTTNYEKFTVLHKFELQWWMGKLPQHYPRQQNHHNAAQFVVAIQQK